MKKEFSMIKKSKKKGKRNFQSSLSLPLPLSLSEKKNPLGGNCFDVYFSVSAWFNASNFLSMLLI